MRPMLAVVLFASMFGCGTILNSAPATVSLPPGASVNGQTGQILLDKSQSHLVHLGDGRTCVLESSISSGCGVRGRLRRPRRQSGLGAAGAAIRNAAADREVLERETSATCGRAPGLGDAAAARGSRSPVGASTP